MDEQPVVELKNISKHFGEESARVDALREVSFNVFPGTVIGLRGPSGSGKSTVLNVIGCILEPSSGTMRLNGDTVYDNKWLRSDLRSLRLEKINRTICCRFSRPGRMLRWHAFLPEPARYRPKSAPLSC